MNKMTRGKRLGLIGAAFALVFASLTVASPAQAAAPVLLSGSSWFGGSGVAVCDSSTDTTCGGQTHVGGVSTNWYQCVELAQRFYKSQGWYGGIFAGVGGAIDIYDNASGLGMSRQTNGSITSIVPGDMVVFATDASNGYAGHVAIVDSISGSTINIIEQNTTNDDPTGTLTLTSGSLSRGSGPSVVGVVHDPDNKSVATSTGSTRPLSSDSSDVNADGKSDLVIYDHGHWYIKSAASPYSALEPDFAWGNSDDVPLTGDMDNDGKADLILYRSGTWYVKSATNSPTTRYDVQQGLVVGGANCIPMVGDVNNDGWTDYVADCGGHWDARSGQYPYNWIFQDLVVGGVGDKPFVADFDGDGYDDIGVVSGTQWAARSTNPNSPINRGMLFQGLIYGGTGCTPLVGYFNTDTKADIALDCGGTWQALDVDYTITHNQGSVLTFSNVSLGNSTATPVIGDYWDSDGRSDLGVYNGSVWEAVRGEPSYTAIFTGLGYATGGGTIPISGSESPAGP